MGWSLGFDPNWNRFIGYGVPAFCDHPGCDAEIDRGLAYVCCGQEPYGGERGCGLFFCPKHQHGPEGRCIRCLRLQPPYKRIKPEHPRWVAQLLFDKSWAQWRRENPKEVERLQGVGA